MVTLDHGLIARARNLTTGANIHRTKELIFVYEQAIILHNKGAAKHVVYQRHYENELRQFIERETGQRATLDANRPKDYRALDERNWVVMRQATEAMERSERLERQCQELEHRVTAALAFCNGKKKRRQDAA